mgnify:CR=1 FL=1
MGDTGVASGVDGVWVVVSERSAGCVVAGGVEPIFAWIGKGGAAWETEGSTDGGGVAGVVEGSAEAFEACGGRSGRGSAGDSAGGDTGAG